MGFPRPHAVGCDLAGMDFQLREHLAGMGIDVEMQVKLQRSPPAEEGQPWFALDVGNAGAKEGRDGSCACAPATSCSLGKRRRGQFGCWVFKIFLVFS